MALRGTPDIKQYDGYRGKISFSGAGGYRWVAAGTPNVLLTATEAKEYYQSIGDLHVGSNYRDVMSNAYWLAAYGGRESDLPRTTKDGKRILERLPTIPCHNCGYETPMSTIEVDHYIPSSHPGFRILKALRLLGLTLVPAKGGRKRVVEAVLSKRTPNFLKPKGYEPANYKRMWSNKSPPDKWTATPKGNALLSLLYSYVAESDLSNWCGNSILNLAPLCAPCNLAKTDAVKGLNV